MRSEFRRLLPPGAYREIVSFRSNPPNRIGVLANRLGVRVTQEAMSYGHRGYLDYRSTEKGYVPTVVVGRHLSEAWKRWVVGHELGHHFLEGVDADFILMGDAHDAEQAAFLYLESDDSNEQRAENFAEDLFFGDGALKAAVSLHGRDVGRLANVFKVPSAKIRNRMRFERL
ncbi:ImmA/IrrE family metallo-endopeptidase [Pontivivens ytuae]|uniref:ImmA/IrrE family metallo-endopeptidase n=1 Tax=Pontivivens ytuae TaxID=2789856 RepID=A0A7S9LQS9_9RHOB|nr:ImmA/IrrE family metallo-endopeptidase [Pontivivens ytuae]QPH53517.1 ImmA/IrrE family metallo-endopeptidase [Pontivivens ytuae]